MAFTIKASRTSGIATYLHNDAGFALCCDQLPTGYDLKNVFYRWSWTDHSGSAGHVGIVCPLRLKSDGSASYNVTVSLDVLNRQGQVLDSDGSVLPTGHSASITLTINQNSGYQLWRVTKSGNAIEATSGAGIVYANESTGSDDTGAGTAGNPYRHLNKIISVNLADNQVWLLQPGQIFTLSTTFAAGTSFFTMNGRTNVEFTTSAQTNKPILKLHADASAAPDLTQTGWNFDGVSPVSEVRLVGFIYSGTKATDFSGYPDARYNSGSQGQSLFGNSFNFINHFTVANVEAYGLGAFGYPSNVSGFYNFSSIFSGAQGIAWYYPKVNTWHTWIGTSSFNSGSHILRGYGQKYASFSGCHFGRSALSDVGRLLMRMISSPEGAVTGSVNFNGPVGFDDGTGTIICQKWISTKYCHFHGSPIYVDSQGPAGVNYQARSNPDDGGGLVSQKVGYDAIEFDSNKFYGHFYTKMFGIDANGYQDVGGPDASALRFIIRNNIFQYSPTALTAKPNAGQIYFGRIGVSTGGRLNFLSSVFVGNTGAYSQAEGFSREFVDFDVPSSLATAYDIEIKNNLWLYTYDNTTFALGAVTSMTNVPAYSRNAFGYNHFRLCNLVGSNPLNVNGNVFTVNYGGTFAAFSGSPTAYKEGANDVSATIAIWNPYTNYIDSVTFLPVTGVSSVYNYQNASAIDSLRYDFAGKIRPAIMTAGAMDFGTSSENFGGGGGGGGGGEEFDLSALPYSILIKFTRPNATVILRQR